MRKGEVKGMKDEKIDLSTNGGCSICENPTEEIIILLNQLKNRLALKIKECSEDYEDTDERTYIPPIATFSSLLNIILGDKLYSKTETPTCRHEKMFMEFKKKLRCTQKALKQGCKAISYQIGSRNYHFQLLNQQVHNRKIKISSVVGRAEKQLPSTKNNQEGRCNSEKKQKKRNSFSLKFIRRPEKKQHGLMNKQQREIQEPLKNNPYSETRNSKMTSIVQEYGYPAQSFIMFYPQNHTNL